VNNWERSLLSSERPVEVMARWEKQRATNQNLQFKFVMKKHLFVDIDLADPVEKELVYHQLLHQARNDRSAVFSLPWKNFFRLLWKQCQFNRSES
jgi:hypothetical protein